MRGKELITGCEVVVCLASSVPLLCIMAKPFRRSSYPPPDPPTPRSSPAPSSALLSALAGIVAASPISPNPAPPSFLCPSASSGPSSAPRRSFVPSPLRSRYRRSLAPPTRTHLLPYKFEPDDDGIWKYVDSYSLYGSTICLVSCFFFRLSLYSSQPCKNSCEQPTSVTTADEVSTSPITTDSIDLHDSMPVGWTTEITHDDNRTTLILVLSLVLAFFICFFMIGCLLWRKTVKRRRKVGDVEMKARRKRTSTSAMSSSVRSSAEEQKDARGKQKIWARASARWRERVRYTARLRRANRSSNSHLRRYNSSTILNPTVPLEIPDDDILSPQSKTPTPSRSVSRQPSASLTDYSRSSSHVSEETSDSSDPSPSLTVEPVSHVSSSPPAYRPDVLSSIAVSTEQPDGLVGSTFSRGPVSPSNIKLAQRPEFPHVVGLHAAHIATDDKALLARLADLAERPPETSIDVGSSHQVSVPLWEDEQLDGFHRMSESSEVDTSCSSPFPPPPSKGKMAESSFYAYRSSFEEFSGLIDPELEPSAPPFEALSAPGLDAMTMLPSAPPLADNGFPLEECFSAPEFEAAAENDGAPISAAIDGDRSNDHQLALTARPSSQGMLPGYHP